jgi:hypothetical protein
VALLASILAGVSWIAAIATLNVSAQFALPDWVRGRGLAMYMTVLFGSVTIGSVLWGQLAGLTSLSTAHFVAAAGMLLAIPITWRWKQTSDKLDLTPSMQWPAPIVSRDVEGSDGPVLVTIEYRVADLKNRGAFLVAMDRLQHERLRDGAYRWGIFEDTADPGRFVETFLVASWTEHLRQHERVTNADIVSQQHVERLLTGEPRVNHFVAHSAH